MVVDRKRIESPFKLLKYRIIISKKVIVIIEILVYFILWIFEEIIFNMNKKINIEIIDDRIIVRMIIIKEGFLLVISYNAIEAPVLNFFKVIMVIKEVAITRVFIEPKRIRNSSSFILFINLDPIIAPWLLPRPGSIEQIGEIIDVIIKGLFILFIFILPTEFFCFGITVFLIIEFISKGNAKNPVNKGSRLSFVSLFNTMNPKIPEDMKIKKFINL